MHETAASKSSVQPAGVDVFAVSVAANMFIAAKAAIANPSTDFNFIIFVLRPCGWSQIEAEPSLLSASLPHRNRDV